MNHTQGKWEAVISHKKDDYIIWAGDEGVFIATTQSVPPAAHETGMYGKQANANLIAAAPEMLSLLKRFLEAPGYKEGRDNTKWILLEEMKAVTTKAEGKGWKTQWDVNVQFVAVVLVIIIQTALVGNAVLCGVVL